MHCAEYPVISVHFSRLRLRLRRLVAYCNFLERSNGMIIGLPFRACDFLKASVTIGELSVRMVVPIDMKKLHAISKSTDVSQRYLRTAAYPNVAADPAIYCPSVLSMPFGPGPNLMMFVAPKMKPIMMPTAAARQLFVHVALSGLHSSRTASHHSSHFSCGLLARFGQDGRTVDVVPLSKVEGP